jgi:hypothetical protein
MFCARQASVRYTCRVVLAREQELHHINVTLWDGAGSYVVKVGACCVAQMEPSCKLYFTHELVNTSVVISGGWTTITFAAACRHNGPA